MQETTTMYEPFGMLDLWLQVVYPDLDPDWTSDYFNDVVLQRWAKTDFDEIVKVIKEAGMTEQLERLKLGDGITA